MISIKKTIEKISKDVYDDFKDIYAKEAKLLTKQEEERFAIHITTHKGKLAGIPSINTSSLTNPYCVERSKREGTICSKCYSNSLSKIRKQLENKLKMNSAVLSDKIIPFERLPLFNNLYVRLSSFGDLINMTHLKNLFNIARKNPKTTFALWTKRTDLIKKADSRIYLPNLIVIYSNPIIDKPIYEVPNRFDKVFQVFSKGYGVNINCGAKNCLSCLSCYELNDITIINERVK